MSLTLRLLLLVALALLPPLAIQGWGTFEQYHERQAAVRRQAIAQTQAIQAGVVRVAEGLHSLLIAVASLPSLRAGDAEGCTRYLTQVVGQFDDYMLLAANDADSKVLCNSLGTAPGAYSNADRAYNRRAMESGRFAVGDLVVGIATGRSRIHFALPFRKLDGAPGGIVLVTLEQARLLQQVRSAAMPAGATALVIDPSGTVIVDSSADGSLGGRPAPPALLAALSTGTGTFTLDGPSDRARIFGVVPPDPLLGGLRVTVGLDQRRAFADIVTSLRRNLMSLALGAVLALTAGLLAGRRFVLAPLGRLVAAADRLGRGDLHRIALGRPVGELRELSAAFDRMSTAVTTRETERDRAQAQRAQTEQRLGRILATIPAGVIELDPHGTVTYANATAERILGAGPGTLLGLRHDDGMWQVTGPDGSPVPPGGLPGDAGLRGDAVSGVEHGVRTMDGRRIGLRLDVAHLPDPAGGPGGALIAFQDVSGRQRALLAQRESEARYRVLFDAIDAGLCVLHMKFDAAGHPVDYRFIEVNAAFARQTGLDDAAGRWMRDLVPDLEQHWFDLYGSVARTGTPLRFENEAKGLGRWYEVHAFRMGLHGEDRVAVLFNDISSRRQAEEELRRANEGLETRVEARTAELHRVVNALHEAALERERTEELLRQSQKMEAVGQLTGGIAHDFNNMLQAIAGSLELMHRRVAQGRAEAALPFLANARETVQRAAALTNRLLAFARRQALDPKPVDPAALIGGMAELVRRAAGPGVALHLDLDAAGWAVSCDPNQLENVLLNLAINARDAMPDGGTLTMTVARRHLDAPGPGGAPPGDYVEIAVADTGLGMDETTQARVFEPFFTTKPLGQGTGLGLSQVYGFVNQSGGFVRLDSAPGQGTTVRITLPRDAALDVAVPAPGAAIDPGRTRGTVLLVEDEADIRAATAEHLRDAGFRVLDAGEGAAALDLLRDPAGFDILITDVGLPGQLNGRQVADAARSLRPGLPVLFVTGYAAGALDTPLPPDMAILAKPFSLDELMARVTSMLATRAAAPGR